MVAEELCKLNSDASVHGILVFMPLPKHMDEAAVRALIAPGKDVDVLVTQGGIAVNPRNTELKQRLEGAGLPVIDIQALKEKTEAITGKPQPIPRGDRIVAKVIGRTGQVQDYIYNMP